MVPLGLVLSWTALLVAQASSTRNIDSLTSWAKQQGIELHDCVQFQQFDDSNWGLQLRPPFPPAGTVLLKVPRHIVLDSNAIREECVAQDGPDKLQQALKELGDYNVHADGFLIFLKLLRECRKASNSQWSPWIQAMPKRFTQFSASEKECLPYYARYAADYQDRKWQAFCRAVVELEQDSDSLLDQELLQWAFHAVGSRFWKTDSKREGYKAISELVPVGDMFNHREPPNVVFHHDERNGSVEFVYVGEEKCIPDSTDCNDGSRDLYISYGQPSNPHRFLVIFGFCPTDMPSVWSHHEYPDNPFSAQVSEMFYRVADGAVPKMVWDAVLYALLQPDLPPGEIPIFTEQQHSRYKEFTVDVLRTHVAKQLSELEALRPKIDALDMEENNNIDLIHQHNEFLSNVFAKVLKRLETDKAFNKES